MTHALSRWAAGLKGVVMGPNRVESAPWMGRRHDPRRSNMLQRIDLSGRVHRRIRQDAEIISGPGTTASLRRSRRRFRLVFIRQTTGFDLAGLIWWIQMRAVFGRPEAMRTRWSWRRLSLSAVSVGSQRKQRESHEHEQINGCRGSGAGTREGLDRRPRRGANDIRVGLHGVGSAHGITIPKRWCELYRRPFSRS
jgi:hypothetical protein